MPPTMPRKRKLPSSGFQRRVRARKEEAEPELEEYSQDSQEEESDGDLDSISNQGGQVSDEVGRTPPNNFKD